MRHFWPSGHGIWVCVSFCQCIQTHVPKIILLIVTIENELVSYIVAGASTRVWIGTILCLEFWIKFLNISFFAPSFHIKYSIFFSFWRFWISTIQISESTMTNTLIFVCNSKAF